MGKNRPILFEVLEPRILLSGDGLLNAIIPDQDQDTLQNGVQQVIQSNELLDIKEQVEEQMNHELVPSETPNISDYQSVFTLFPVDNTNDESANADLSVDNVGSTQVNNEITVLSKDTYDNTESKVSTIENENPQVYVNDTEISIEENTSIEIRGPPSDEIGLDNTISCCLESERPEEVDLSILNEYTMEVQASGVVSLTDIHLDGVIVVENEMIPLGIGPYPNIFRTYVPYNEGAAGCCGKWRGSVFIDQKVR